MSDPTAPSDLAYTFNLILDGLCRVVAARMSSHHATIPVLTLLWKRLRRSMARFASLVARFRAGTLKPPRRRAPDEDQPREKPELRLPQGYAWLIRWVPQGAAAFGSQLQYFMDLPEMQALLEAAPQAGRILRPLCHMLAVPLPPALRLPPRPPRPPRPKPARPPPDPDKLLARRARWPNGTLKRPGPPEPGVVWKKWRGIWMPEPVRTPKPA